MSSDEKLDEILRRIGLMETGIQNLGSRLEAVERDLSSHEGAMGTSFKALDARVVALKGEIIILNETMVESFSKLGKKIDIINKELLEVKPDNARLNELIDDPNRKPS